jgi:hypothetical protein
LTGKPEVSMRRALWLNFRIADNSPGTLKGFDMGTKDTPQGIVGFKFAHALLSGDYETAHSLLSTELKVEYPVPSLKQNFEEMMNLAEEPAELPEIQVLDNTYLGESSLDAEGWAYVAIWSEAVTVTAKPFGSDYLITELIWGRP